MSLIRDTWKSNKKKTQRIQRVRMKGNPNKKERIGLDFMQMAREQKNRGI